MKKMVYNGCLRIFIVFIVFFFWLISRVLYLPKKEAVYKFFYSLPKLTMRLLYKAGFFIYVARTGAGFDFKIKAKGISGAESAVN